MPAHKIDHAPQPMCIICGQAIRASGRRLLTAKYCSRKCQAEGQRTGEELGCAVCGKRFWAWRSQVNDGRRYCSMACRARGAERQVTRSCLACGRAFQAPENRVRRGIALYCGNECKFSALRDRVTRQCAQCGQAFEITRHRAQDPERGRFCGKQCYYGYAGMGPSGAELALEGALAAEGICFRREVPVGRWSVDFLIAGATALEVDSAFWHSLPGVAEKDAAKALAIADQGWHLLRLDAARVAADPMAAVAVIKEVLHASA